MKIGIIGAGNVAWNLAAGLQESPFRVQQIISRSGTNAQSVAQELGIPRSGSQAADLDQGLDLVIIASSDHAIPQIARDYAAHRGPRTIFAHTSGSTPLSALEALGEHIGVFYPMQTFTKGRRTNWRAVPLFLEGDPAILSRMEPVAHYLSGRVRPLDSEGRLRLHMGAVFAHNFSNFMWLQAEKLVTGLGDADIQIYANLMREGLEKALSIGPNAAQTGPARRGDQSTMDQHLALLNPKDAELYRQLSQRIWEHFDNQD